MNVAELIEKGRAARHEQPMVTVRDLRPVYLTEVMAEALEALTKLPTRDELARAYDPAAFEHHPAEERRAFAAVQWGARRHLALEAADRVLASGLL